MYFGPAVKVKKPKEFWHGTLWRQSPLFGEDTVMVRGELAWLIFILRFDILFYAY
jgi:hypothetical protein